MVTQLVRFARSVFPRASALAALAAPCALVAACGSTRDAPAPPNPDAGGRPDLVIMPEPAFPWDAGVDAGPRVDEVPRAERALGGPGAPRVVVSLSGPPSALALSNVARGALLAYAADDGAGLTDVAVVPLLVDATADGPSRSVISLAAPPQALGLTWDAKRRQVLLAVDSGPDVHLALLDEAGGLLAPVIVLPRGDLSAGRTVRSSAVRIPGGFLVAHALDPDTVALDTVRLRSTLESTRRVLHVAIAVEPHLVTAVQGVFLTFGEADRRWAQRVDLQRPAFALPQDPRGQLLSRGRGLLWVGTPSALWADADSGTPRPTFARPMTLDGALDGQDHLLFKAGADVLTDLKPRPAGGWALLVGRPHDETTDRGDQLARFDDELAPEGEPMPLDPRFRARAHTWRRDGGLVCGELPHKAGDSVACIGFPQG